MNPDTVAEIERLYATLPEVRCRRQCQDACGPILMTKIEHDRILERAGDPGSRNGSEACPLLSLMGNCTVYDIRPMVCRIYGVSKALRCPHGCVPERWLNDDDSTLMLQKLMDLSGNDQLFLMPPDGLDFLKPPAGNTP